MNRREKRVFVEKFLDLKNQYPCMIVVRQFGMTADLSVLLRRDLHQMGGIFCVVPNRLVLKALEKEAVPQPFKEAFVGPTGVVFTKDPVSASKILVEFSKKSDKKLDVLVGVLDEQLIVDAQIVQLSSLPPLEQLRVQLLGLLLKPATRLVFVLKEAQARCVRVLEAYRQKQI